MGLGRHTVQAKRKLYGHNRLSRLPPVHNRSNQKRISQQLQLSRHSYLFVYMNRKRMYMNRKRKPQRTTVAERIGRLLFRWRVLQAAKQRTRESRRKN